MQQGHPYWERTMDFARGCSWRAGPVLADRMAANAFGEQERVIVAVDGGEIAGFCTFSERDELPEDAPFGPFAGFVFVDEKHRGQRLSGRMIDRAAACARAAGRQKLYVLSGEQGLYEKYGFVKIGTCRTVWGTTEQLFERPTAETPAETASDVAAP